MKLLLNKFLGGKDTPSNSNNEQPNQLSTPTLLTSDSIQLHQRLSLVGWIANKLAQLLELESAQTGFYLKNALTKDLTALDKNNQEDYLFYLAHHLVSWIEDGQDVYFNLKQMNLEANYHKNLLIVFETIKEDNYLYFNRKAPDVKELTEEDKVWAVYRDVLHAASQMKFLLVKEQDLPKYKKGRFLCNESVVEKTDIPRVRNFAKEVLEQEGYPKTAISTYILLISEAITNILKHAKDGRLMMVRSQSSLNIIIEDKGSGFTLKTLPYTVLMAGYSTKKSLGQGFTLMLKLATRVLLKTSSDGSTIILIFEENEGENSGKSS